MSEKVTVLMNAVTFQVTFEKRGARGATIKIYNSRMIARTYAFIYGIPFTKESFLNGATAISDPFKDLKLPYEFPLIVSDTAVKDLAFVKSALQKSIRRGNVNQALSCAKTMMCINTKSFLRRLVVIAAEDVFFNQHCFPIIWFHKMISMECFHLSKRHVDWILGFVKQLCEEPRFVDYGKDPKLQSCGNMEINTEMINLFLNATDLMEGDAKMLKWYHNNAKEWEHLPIPKVEFVDVETVEYITVRDFPLEAVDFHTNARMPSMILSRLQKSMKDSFTEEEIKYLIWTCRSSVNIRKQALASEQDMTNYRLIENHVEAISKLLLHRKQELNKLGGN